MRTAMLRFAAIVALALFLLPALLPSTAAAQSPDLERAYKKEFAYLEAQKRALQARLAEVDAQAAQKTAAVQAEVDRLQGRQLALAAEADRLQQLLVEAEREASFVEERSDALVAMMEQARASLAAYDVEVQAADLDAEAETVDPARVEAVFDRVAAVIDQGGQVRTEPGAFFLADGQKVDGEIVRVGRIASYGVSPQGAGALAPAGEGALKLWGAASAEDSAEGQATARALAAGKSPDTLGVFLYENLEKPVEERAEQTMLEFIAAGGVIGWVIVGIGLLALLLALIRALTLWRASSTAVAAVLAETRANLGRDREALEDVVSEAILRQTPPIERFGAAIMVFAAVSPLLGLLGTVTGMIATFDIITEYGTGDPKMLSGGISEALITTQLGLVVAIPALLLGNLLNGRANALLGKMEYAALQLINRAEAGDAPAGGVSSTAPVGSNGADGFAPTAELQGALN